MIFREILSFFAVLHSTTSHIINSMSDIVLSKSKKNPPENVGFTFSREYFLRLGYFNAIPIFVQGTVSFKMSAMEYFAFAI